jgi:hypothetical protein
MNFVLPPSCVFHFVFITVIVILSSSLLWSPPPACMVSILEATNYRAKLLFGDFLQGSDSNHVLHYNISRHKTCHDLETCFSPCLLLFWNPMGAVVLQVSRRVCNVETFVVTSVHVLIIIISTWQFVVWEPFKVTVKLRTFKPSVWFWNLDREINYERLVNIFTCIIL